MTSTLSNKVDAILALPTFVWWWMFIASFLVSVDCTYILGISYGLQAYVPQTILNLWGWYGETDHQYSVDGIKDSNGWIETQSLFNVFEVIINLTYLFLLHKPSIQAVLAVMLVSLATLWKTLIYMSIIIHSQDPVQLVPGLQCLGYRPLEVNQDFVNTALLKDNCYAQFFKFQFNFWWIGVPAIIIIICWRRICKVVALAKKDK
jgi:hypothetical protein